MYLVLSTIFFNQLIRRPRVVIMANPLVAFNRAGLVQLWTSNGLGIKNFDKNITVNLTLIQRQQTKYILFQDIGFPYKLLISANKEIELFNVRPSFVSAPPQQR